MAGGPFGPPGVGPLAPYCGATSRGAQNNTLNLFGGRAWCRGGGGGYGGEQGESEIICDGAAEGKGNTNAIRSWDSYNINVCP